MPNYRRSDMCQAIDDYVINIRYRQLLKLRFCEGLTYEQISGITHYSVQHVKYVCKKYKDYLINCL